MTDLPSSAQLIPFSRSPMNDMFFEVGAYAEALARLQLMVSNSGLGVLPERLAVANRLLSVVWVRP